jgi:RNA polymerase sigma-70 factor (ECF subfamily)
MNVIIAPLGGSTVPWRRAPEREARLRQRLFEEMVMTHLDALYRTALRLTSSREHAEDLVQETCLRAYRAFDRFDGRYARAWLFTILRNTHISHLRHNGQAPHTVLYEEDPPAEAEQRMPATASAEDVALAHVLEEDLERALETLPEGMRLILMLAYVEELSYAEIARVLQCPLGTVMSRLYRARKLMEEQLSKSRTPSRG